MLAQRRRRMSGPYTRGQPVPVPTYRGGRAGANCRPAGKRRSVISEAGGRGQD